MELTNKASYLPGLMDGLGIDENTKEGKVLKAMSDLLKEMAETIEDLSVELDETVELVDTLDQDLGDVEEIVYDLDDDDDEDDDFEDCEYECVCPTCGDTIYLDESLVEEGSIDCPNCGEKLEFDFEEEEEEGKEE